MTWKEFKSGVEKLGVKNNDELFNGCNNRRPFVVFWGQKYYAAPGWQGYIGDAETLEQAIEIGKEKCEDEYEWWQVVDLRKRKIVAGEGSSHTGLFGEFPANPGA